MATTVTDTFTHQGSVNLLDLRYSISQARTNFTRVRGANRDRGTAADFITLVCLICEIYRNNGDELASVGQFHPSREKQYNKGHTSTVSHTEVSRNSASRIARGTTSTNSEVLIVKRPRESILEEKSYALISFITELRVRTHPPLRAHPNIARFRGVGWDFEDEDATIPRPLLLEELAPQGALDNFWKKWKFVQMNFKSKLDMCRDVAEGLLALHQCGVVHGDVKPENILVFPRHDANETFTVKLTDFGHSVFEHNRLNALPAFTPKWCAPEVQSSKNLTFRDMKATDFYSYGLVILSIMIARPFHEDFKDVEAYQKDDTMLSRLIQLIKKEDKENNNSDFDVGVIYSLLNVTVRLNPRYRNVNRCLSIMKRYDKINGHDPRRNVQNHTKALPALNVNQMVTIGYQTLSQCSHQLKEHITTKLIQIGSDSKDPRRVSAAWELTVCYFSGFGVPVSFQNSSHWLLVALKGGVPAAFTFFEALNGAMNIECDRSLIYKTSSQTAVGSVPNTISEHDGEAPKTAESESNDLDEESDTESDLESENHQDPNSDEMGDGDDLVPLPEEALSIIKYGTLKQLQDFLETNPKCLNSQDTEGNTLLLLAAKRESKEMIEFLVSQDDLDASIPNRSERTILHFLAPLDDSTNRELVPRLVQKRADINHEALPSRSGSDAMMFSAGIRCCSVLNAIFHGNLGLLSCLLEASHPANKDATCRICEGGSRFRRILAVCLSIFQADAMERLVEHIKSHKDSYDINLSRIEVWAGQELLPLHKVPFNSVAVAAMDLPESFFRAINYGDKYADSLERTIRFLLTTRKDVTSLSYSMLKEATARGSVDAVNFILREGRERGFQERWWLRGPISDSPLLESIRLGSRETYGAFLEDFPAIFSRNLELECWRGSCPVDYRSWWAELAQTLTGIHQTSVPAREHTHPVNAVQTALNIFVEASHQDNFFLNSILSLASVDLVTAFPASFFVRSILNSSFAAATFVAKRFPEIWSPQRSTYCPGDGDYAGPEVISMRFHGFKPTYPISIILSEGSYKQVQFALNEILPMRTSQSSNKFKKTTKGRKCQAQEDGIPEWNRCPLSPKEYDYLVLGSIGVFRTDREQLWNLIQEQVTLGHSRSIYYLHLAISRGDTHSLQQMLTRGWSANGPFWGLFMTPLQLSERFHIKAAAYKWHLPSLFGMLNSDLPQDEWSGSATHRAVYLEYSKQRDGDNLSEWTSRLESCQTILRSHGGTISPLVTLLRKVSPTIKAWAFIIYILMYLVVMPFALVYGTTDTWTSMSIGQKFGFVYLWAPLALGLPPILYFANSDSWPAFQEVMIWIILSTILFVVNHIILPILIIQLNWRPFLSCKHFVVDTNIASKCTNYSFLVPIAVAGIEGLVCFTVQYLTDGVFWDYFRSVSVW